MVCIGAANTGKRGGICVRKYALQWYSRVFSKALHGEKWGAPLWCI